MRPPTRFASALGWVESINSWKRGRADAAGAIAAPTASQSWSNLDSRGNWVAWNDGTGNQTRVHSGANEIQSIQVGSATTPLQWDGAGNRLADGTSAFAWSIRGLMDTVKRDGAVLGTYGYDALGRRNLKVAGGRRTVFVYDGWQCVWQKVTGSGTDTTKAFVYANYIDEPVNMVRKWGSSTDTLWYMQGNNFNVEALTDRTGAIVERYEYTPYGKVTIFTGAGPDGKWLAADDVVSTTSARGNSLTFQGREFDAETGLYYFRNRYYSAGLGRFVSRDPIRFDDRDINIYRFTKNDPFGSRDYLGLEACCDGVSCDYSDITDIMESTDAHGPASAAYTTIDRAQAVGKYRVIKDLNCDCYKVCIDRPGVMSIKIVLPRVGSVYHKGSGISLLDLLFGAGVDYLVDQAFVDAVKAHEMVHASIIREQFQRYTKAAESVLSGCSACGDDAYFKVSKSLKSNIALLKSAWRGYASNALHSTLDANEHESMEEEGFKHNILRYDNYSNWSRIKTPDFKCGE